MKEETRQSRPFSAVSSTVVVILLIALVSSLPSPAEAQVGMRTLTSLSGGWPCYYKSQDRWYDCPTRVISGRYVLGDPIRPPAVNVAREFTVAEPGRLFVDGVARCEGCQQLLNDRQFQLQVWDGSRWGVIPLGLGDRVQRCMNWADSCQNKGRADSVAVRPGRYRLWAHTGYGTGSGGELYPRTQLELGVHLLSDRTTTGSVPSPGVHGSLVGEVEWVQCVRSSPFSSGIGEVVDCRGKGLWRIDDRDNNLARLSASDRVQVGDRLKTDGDGLARIRLQDGGVVTLYPGTQLGLQRPGPNETEILLFGGRILSFFDNRMDGSYRVITANAISGVNTATAEVSYDPSSGVTEVVVADGDIELSCPQRREAQRAVRAGERARVEGDCAVCFDFPPREELDRLTALGSLAPAGSSFSSGEPPTTGTGTYVGCFKDGGEAQGVAGHDLDGEVLWPSSLTPELCVGECAERGYAYAGVQWGRACFCGSGYGRFGKSDECKTPCWGDSQQICGGFNVNSVYETGGGGLFSAPAEESAPAALQTPVPANSVIVYRDANYTGRGSVFTSNVARLSDTPIGNDQASSVRVAPGCRATLYEHSDYRGRLVQVVGDLADLGRTPLGNDQAGSVRLECR